MSHICAHAVSKTRETHLLSDVLAASQVMITVRQDLWLYDGHNAMLADKRTIVSHCGELNFKDLETSFYTTGP